MICKATCLIVTYNATRNNWIYNCLSSLVNSTYPPEIIVIDNCSTDNTRDIIENEYPQVHLIKNSTNLGFGKANNLGFETALRNGADYFFLLNQDAWVETDTIEKLVKVHKKNPEYGIISPLHLNGVGDALDFNFSNYISPNHCKNLYSDYVLNKVENRIYESGFINAAAWLVSKECLRKVGGFSPTFFHYGEDDNYIQRLKYKGLKIGVLPTARIFHDREQRSENTFFKSEVSEERRFLLEYSNPNKNLSIDSELKKLKLSLLKYKMLRDKTASKFILNKIKIRRKFQNIIEENLEKSKSNNKFIFLDYE